MAESRRLYPDFDITRTWALPPVPPLAGETLLDYLRRIGFTDAQISYTRRTWANAAGDSPEYLDAAASLDEMGDTSAGEGDFRILEGYGKLIEALAEGLDIRLNTEAVAVEWGRKPIRVYTAAGEVFEADHVVIAVPLSLLQRGCVRFDPPLPADKQAAIDTLRVGPAIKMFYRFDTPILPPGIMALYSPHNPPMWWTPSGGREGTDGQQVMTGFASGDWARGLLALGEAGALEQGLRTLETELGKSLTPAKMHLQNWVADPYSLGGYSITPPGARGMREVLARQTADALFWAGEATGHKAEAATVHGAYLSGRRAAREILALRD
jgi:monoamine oxidase